MFHNTAYPIPSGYDARKPVKTLEPLVYMMLSSFLAILLKLRNCSHFQCESAERKQKAVDLGGGVGGNYLSLKKYKNIFAGFSLFGYSLFRIYFHSYLKVI